LFPILAGAELAENFDPHLVKDFVEILLYEFGRYFSGDDSELLESFVNNSFGGREAFFLDGGHQN
jgi:hypothetical protein